MSLSDSSFDSVFYSSIIGAFGLDFEYKIKYENDLSVAVCLKLENRIRIQCRRLVVSIHKVLEFLKFTLHKCVDGTEN